MPRDEAVLAEMRQRREEAAERFRAHLEGLMEERGIESVEELHRRFVETEYAYIPVPGLHRGKPVSLELFRRLVTGQESRYFYGELMGGLREVFELTEEEFEELSFVYIWGERPSARQRQA